MPDTTGVVDSFAVEPGTELYRRSWPLEQADANILIVHGYGEHCGRYEDAASRFNAAGYGVFSYDHRAHGNSPGKMGHIRSFNALVSDLNAIVETVKGEVDSDKPLFIWGHSMGGLVTTAFVLRHSPDVTGVVLTGPLVKSDESISPALKAIAKLLAVFLPGLPVLDLDATGVSRDDSEVDAYVNDPLVYHGRISARTGNEFAKTIDFVEANFQSFKLPVYILHGKQDRLVSYRASEEMFDGITSSDKKLKIWDDAYHELHNDTIRDEFYSDVIDWLGVRS